MAKLCFGGGGIARAADVHGGAVVRAVQAANVEVVDIQHTVHRLQLLLKRRGVDAGDAEECGQ